MQGDRFSRPWDTLWTAKSTLQYARAPPSVPITLLPHVLCGLSLLPGAGRCEVPAWGFPNPPRCLRSLHCSQRGGGFDFSEGASLRVRSPHDGTLPSITGLRKHDRRIGPAVQNPRRIGVCAHSSQLPLPRSICPPSPPTG